MDPTCPKCGNSDQSKVHGYEIRGVYDGILFWGCAVCGHKWPRFMPSSGRLYDAGVKYIKLWNEPKEETSNA